MKLGEAKDAGSRHAKALELRISSTIRTASTIPSLTTRPGASTLYTSRMRCRQAFRSRMQVVFTIGSGAGKDHELVEWLAMDSIMVLDGGHLAGFEPR